MDLWLLLVIDRLFIRGVDSIRESDIPGDLSTIAICWMFSIYLRFRFPILSDRIISFGRFVFEMCLNKFCLAHRFGLLLSILHFKSSIPVVKRKLFRIIVGVPYMRSTIRVFNPYRLYLCTMSGYQYVREHFIFQSHYLNE